MADRKNQMMVLGVVVVGVLWINGQGDSDADNSNGKSPKPHQTGRYPVHFEKDDAKKDTKKQPQPRTTVSYPIKFDQGK